MNDEPRQTLCELLVEYGRSLCEDPRRCEALLKDHCGAHKREIFVLVSALKHRVAADLLQPSAGVPQVLLLGRLTQRLEAETGLAEAAARWAVDSWALALGLPVERSAPPQPAPTPPPITTPAIETPLASPPTASPPLPVFRDRLRDGSEGPAMVVIPAGEFWMGSPESEPEAKFSERQHRVVIARPFAIGQYAVTFAEYDRFCAATGRGQPDDYGWGRDNRPVIDVNWYDALDYTEWLSEQTGQTYRLPTEAEWEYSCRAGTQTPFWWGESITTDQANYDGSEFIYGPRGRLGVWRGHTVPVKKFQPNPWGLYQVHGNVWEWTGSVYDGDYGGAQQRCAGREEGAPRSVRGGAWVFGPVDARSADRSPDAPFKSRGFTGFRLARSL